MAGRPVIIAIDPGVKLAGVATHEDGELTSAFLVKGVDALNTASCVWNELIGQFPIDILNGAELVVEKPQVYRQNLLRGDPNDLIDVAIMGSAIAAHFSNVVWYLPREWKGQMPKSVVERLIKEELSPEELEWIE
ncbi:hypothetical protein LCGC14_2391090, partial [marine sediment metagenome]